MHLININENYININYISFISDIESSPFGEFPTSFFTIGILGKEKDLKINLSAKDLQIKLDETTTFDFLSQECKKKLQLIRNELVLYLHSTTETLYGEEIKTFTVKL